MAKLVIDEITSGYLSTEKLNAILEQIEDALDNTLSRDGTTPNQMEADLDLNGHSLLNASFEGGPTSLVTLEYLQDYVDARASGLLAQTVEEQTATAGQTEFVLTDIMYEAGANNIAVYRDGVRLFTPTDYTETSSTVVTLTAAASAGEVYTFVHTNFLANVNLPEHSHNWSQITSKPESATRWPDWVEVTGKPTTFTPATHTHSASAITSGSMADARRGVYVQSSTPTAARVGELWFW
jgi:hypothetical protein